MAKNFVQPGEAINFIAPYQRDSGKGALLGTLFGVATFTVANGVEGVFETTGVWDLDKVSAQAWTAGALVYWDDTAKLVTTTTTSNTRIGIALTAAANPSATGRVRLNGTAAVTGA